jgi:phospholipid/cholesterol/gamma-HCH transport system substrate-binding protein
VRLNQIKEFKPFSDRNPFVIGLVGVGVTVAFLLVALNYSRLPFVDRGREYSAYLAEAGGLYGGAEVQVSGANVGKVTGMSLDGPRVLVKFTVDRDIRLGERTEASVRLKTVLGTKLLEVTPRGDGRLSGPIPLDRTTPAYQLPDALGDLSNTISGLDTDQLSNSLSVLAKEFANTPADLKNAVQGVGRLSQTLEDRNSELRNLLANAYKVTKVLADRSDEVVNLVRNANALLVELQTQNAALDQITGNLSALAQQVKGFIGDNRTTLKPALDKLNGVLAIVDNRKGQIQSAIKKLNAYAGGLGEAVASGPFFKAYLANLPPGQYIQPFIDAAFSDLGLDPSTLSPTERSDPQTGQPATPPGLPLPYPRTGQGGEPALNLPDAITGNLDPNMPAQFPGRYPYQDPPAAPPPGGPPPGPPAPEPPGPSQKVEPPLAVGQLPAPGQIPPSQPPVLNGPGPIGPLPGPDPATENGQP